MSEAMRIEEIPPLMAGDRLSRWEFEQRYQASPKVKKAELIEGVVYVASPLSRAHALAHSALNLWLRFWSARHPGSTVADNGTFRLDYENEPQPDLALCLEGDGSHTDEEGFLAGTPSLIVEVAYSSSSYDLHQKKAVYQRHGIPTYIVWRVREKKLSWFELDKGVYIEHTADGDGIFRSRRHPGLWLDPAAIGRDDSARIIELLEQGHQAPR